NSFNKGYEQAFVGLGFGVFGILLFIAAMFYVPMAQAHQAATGQARAFFDFRFVWRLIQARLTAYIGQATVMLLVALPLEVLKTFPAFEAFPGNDEALTDAEALEYFQGYIFWCSLLVLFPALLLVRWLAVVIYRSAVLKVLRDGLVTREDLNPVLAPWLDR